MEGVPSPGAPVSPAGLLAILPLAAITACGGGGGDDKATATTTAATGDSTATAVASPAGTPAGPLSDKEYLAVICGGLEDYTAAVLREQTVEGLSSVVRNYIASLQAVLPPEDLADFHEQFIDYLTAAVDSPTDLLATPRPLPPEKVRQRLADLEDQVDECRDARFFSVRAEDPS